MKAWPKFDEVGYRRFLRQIYAEFESENKATDEWAKRMGYDMKLWRPSKQNEDRPLLTGGNIE